MITDTALASQGAKPVPQRTSLPTLRALIEGRKAEGRQFSIDETIAVIVPVCLDLKERHERGELLFVHPSAIAPSADGLARLQPELAGPPVHPNDRHCLAPELQAKVQTGGERSSVYSVGAMLYEMVTGDHIGPAMRRPRDIVPNLPEALEILIGKAIIGDPTHRPADLGALASALYHIAPAKSIHPPEVSERQIDASAELDVDIKFSMMPPNFDDDRVGGSNGASSARTALKNIPKGARVPDFSPAPPPVVEPAPPPPRPETATQKLSALKERLEADPRPRYVVHRDMMDHGPFTAVELLQQIASHTFVGEDVLRDDISGESNPIQDWEEFAPFALHTGLARERAAEESEVVQLTRADEKKGMVKVGVALAVLGAIVASLGVWYFARRGIRTDEITIEDDKLGATVELDGGVKGKKRAPAGRGGGGGGYVGGGQSYEAVLNSNNDTMNIGENAGPDLTNAQLAAPLRNVSFIDSCGAGGAVTIKVAVKMGRPIGVTVNASPPGAAACIDRSVRGMSWPPHPKTDFVTVTF